MILTASVTYGFTASRVHIACTLKSSPFLAIEPGAVVRSGLDEEAFLHFLDHCSRIFRSVQSVHAMLVMLGERRKQLGRKTSGFRAR